MAKTVDWLLAHKDYPHDEWCLIWPFARDPRLGRGTMGAKGWDQWAHRNMCALVHGPAPLDKPIAAHSCGNGHLGCVSPRHLSWSTYSDNQLHRYAEGRGNPSSGNKSMFTPEQIDEIRSKYGEFSQIKLAEMYGCSVGTIQYYLRIREVVRLRKGIQDYLDGNYVNPRKWRNVPASQGKCGHGRYWYEDCGECIDYHFAEVLTGGPLSNGEL